MNDTRKSEYGGERNVRFRAVTRIDPIMATGTLLRICREKGFFDDDVRLTVSAVSPP